MKRMVSIFIISAFFTTLFISLFNYIVDPFQHYRKATLYRISYKHGIQRYLVPGLAKNYVYNSIIAGASMTENFLISDIEKNLNYLNPIKLCLSGGYAYEFSKILEIAFNTHKIENVLFGLDIYGFSGEINQTRTNLPLYMYDNNLFNDYKYLFSLETFFESLKTLVRSAVKPKNDPLLNYDTMFQWQHMHKNEFKIEHVKQKWCNREKKFKLDKFTISNLKDSFNKNFLMYIKKYPNTEFIVFYPPYSILEFISLQNKDYLQTFLDFKLYVAKQSEIYKNLKIYDFQIAKNIILNLSNYKDSIHYSQDISFKIIQLIKKKNF